ncbi:MAG: SusC/RagA family TonB-linked outer membrane protein [Algoriphagus sp.]|jgi:iron complex outermembrane receptor protein|uniref:SusC/RagA family TonB-linked outer membrane protein n=1 Tax=Algoriphagus sp. TaxID=1872435 RepID=UPI0027288CD2|nr:SusC/RagA family TonB-linked outer membrane protein [Algoriphagus sp.]MDO8965390.1 SusC/RagA family TonB-linked outer membrane protein [Algoriphagus sp.]MDP3201429.1 SusC/RagA family TonB-linked outer membrane protein [Algoriphagus sp.]MDP3474047.1 SusC/RagA family TonB-linked outer membrane protein [Algoriphagus sp.]
MRNYLLKLKSLTLALALTIGAIVAVNAQTRSISGTVMDARLGDPVPGATVIVKGTTRGSATDLDGKFTIPLQAGDQVLVISFVGYLTQEIEIGNQSTITINLQEDVQSLQEAVVIGYGSQDKKEITSAVVGVKPEDFNRGNVSNPAQLLQGKVAGLSITRPGGNPNNAFNVRLRGLSTFGANASPLIVLDGVIGASLENVDPNDIQSIDVLKDGSAAAIYGARGSSGVILITTTRQGKKEGTTNVTINSFATMDRAANLIPILSAEEFVARGGNNFGSKTDWRNELIDDALSYTTNASVSGSFGNSNYMASVNYRDNNGIVNGVGNERLNTRLNLSQGALDNKLRFNVNLSFTNVDSESINDAAFRYATIYNPTAPVFENTEDARNRFGGYFQRDLFDFFNPVALARQQKFVGETKTSLTSYRVEYDILPNLTLSGQYSQDRRNTLSGGFWSLQDFQVGLGATGSAERNTFDRKQRIFESTLRYETDLSDKLSMTLLGGAGLQYTTNQGFNARVRQYLFDLGWNNLGAGAIRVGNNTNVSSFANEDQLNSLFGRANFNWDNMIFFSASVRAETYSGFGPNNQTGVFPAVSIGSDFTQIFDMGVFSQFKPRVSFGVTGNLPPSPTLALGVFGNGNRIDLDGDPLTQNDIFVGINQFSNPNRELKWETKEELNFGVDFGLFNNKVTGSVDYYTRNISDLLFNVPVATGAPNPFDPGRFNTAGSTWVNLADLRAAGFEFLASVNQIGKGSLKWSPTFNFTIYDKTSIESLSAGELGFEELRFATPGSPGQNNNPIIYNRVGQNLGDFYGPRLNGLTENGEYILSTTDPNEFEKLGNGLPKGEFGFANSFMYGQWTLNFFFRGAWGHDLYNSYRGFYENGDTASNTWNSVVTDKTPTSPLVKSPPTFNSSLVEDASFIRLDNAELGYNFQTKSPNLSSLRVYFAAQNLFTITNYTGVDPEVRINDSENDNPFTSALSPGIERRNTYFQTRSFTLGVTVNFK